MNPTDESLIQLQQQLRDIHDLDSVSPWPPGPGWWLLLALVLITLALLRWLFRHWHWSLRSLRLNQGWQRDASRQLHALRQRLGTGDGRAMADEFSALLRRIAVARHGRAACASLTGRAWVEWLSAHDPAGFDWTSHRRLLGELAYAPPGETTDHSAELRLLIQAALAWTRAHSTLRAPNSASPDAGQAQRA